MSEREPEQAADAHIASLRAAGAGRFAPVRLRYIEALARRASAHRGGARRLLDARLAQALAALHEDFDRARREAEEIAAASCRRHPHAADELQCLLAGGDFKGLRQFAGTLDAGEQRSALGALAHELERQVPRNTEAHETHVEENAGSRPELKTIRQFRNTLSKLSARKQVAQALKQGPKNAGPINSHMLVLRSLALMRDISPDYLNRFMSYADTLLCLDQDEKEKPANPKRPAGTRAARK